MDNVCCHAAGIVVLESYSLVCTGHADGQVQIFARPAIAAGGPQGNSDSFAFGMYR